MVARDQFRVIDPPRAAPPRLIHVLQEHLDPFAVVEAKQQLKEQKVDLVLLDLSLIGDEDGLDLTRFMRQSKQWKIVPIIAVTAHAFTSDREKCLQAGCNDYLAKPIRSEKLLEMIKAFMKNN